MKQLIARPPDYVIVIMCEDDAEEIRASIWNTEFGTYVHLSSDAGLSPADKTKIERLFESVVGAVQRIVRPVPGEPSSTLVPVPKDVLPF
jgi:hypothetical protein